MIYRDLGNYMWRKNVLSLINNCFRSLSLHVGLNRNQLGVPQTAPSMFINVVLLARLLGAFLALTIM